MTTNAMDQLYDRVEAAVEAGEPVDLTDLTTLANAGYILPEGAAASALGFHAVTDEYDEDEEDVPSLSPIVTSFRFSDLNTGTTVEVVLDDDHDIWIKDVESGEFVLLSLEAAARLGGILTGIIEAVG